MVKPLLYYKQAYDAAEDAYSTLSFNTEKWKDFVNPDESPEAYAKYQRYSGDLERIVSDFSKGMNSNNRRALLSMKRRYAQDIQPIETAYNKREAEIKRQQDVSDKTGGKTVFTRDARTTSLDRYMNNDLEDYGQVNLNDVRDEGIAGGNKISSRYFRTKEGKAFGQAYLQATTEQGLSPEEAMQVLDGSNAFPEFSRFMRDTLEKYGATKGSTRYSDYDRNKIESSLMQGINMGIMHDVKNQYLENWQLKEAIRHQNTLNEIATQKGETTTTPPGVTNQDYGETTLSSSVNINKSREQTYKAIDEFKSKGYFNNRGTLTYRGLNHIKSIIDNIKDTDKTLKSTKVNYLPGVNLQETRAQLVHQLHNDKLYKYLINNGVTHKDLVNWDGTTLKGVDKVNKAYRTDIKNRNDINYAPRTKTDVSMFEQNLYDEASQKAVVSALRKLDKDITIEKFAGINEDGTLKAEHKGIKVGDLKLSDHTPTSIAFVPSEPGAAIITINGEKYKLSPKQMERMLGKQTYSEFYNSARGAAIATTDAQRNNSLNNAHIYMSRLGYTTKYESISRDATLGTNTIYYDEEGNAN
jgi:hypothetical protein